MAGLTPLQVAALLGNQEMFEHIVRRQAGTIPSQSSNMANIPHLPRSRSVASFPVEEGLNPQDEPTPNAHATFALNLR